GHEMSIVVRATVEPGTIEEAALGAVHSIDPDQPVFGVMPMTQLLADAGAARRFSLLLLTLLAGIALGLAALGVYGVMSYTMTQRRHEIGIRLALGAVPKMVFGLLAGQGARLVALGLAIGASGAWVLSRVLDRQLYGVTARDPVAFLGAAAVLGAVAMAA